MSDEQKTEQTEEQKNLETYRQLAAEYGDAVYRREALNRFIAEAERRIQAFEADVMRSRK